MARLGFLKLPTPVAACHVQPCDGARRQGFVYRIEGFYRGQDRFTEQRRSLVNGFLASAP
jgi:hypothetical protein